MRNILLLSTIYPLPEDNKGTAVCHYFTKEWVKMGYNVLAVHVQAVYPQPFYWLASIFSKRIAAKTGAVVYTERLKSIEKYIMDDVPVMRVPVYKPIPHSKFKASAIKKAVKSIVDECRGSSFTPDVVIGHFPNPQIEMLGMLKRAYPHVRTCCVMHGDIEIMKKVYCERLTALMKDIDVWGFRSKTVQEEFENAVGKVGKAFICYSGIPEKYITTENVHHFEKPLHSFVYVGEMIERKYPEKLIDALNQVYPNNDFHLTYIGAGHLIEAIKQKIDRYQLQQQVSILGCMPRDQIVAEYDKADCMVMISRDEAYGLVYLEAMARGCITIASKREGFDGVIVDGVNGFLCEAGNESDLVRIIKYINKLTAEERQIISEKAISTAKRLSDEKAAKMYIDEVMSRIDF